ncbi:hypothetical protein [Faecalispora jeddahensis]|uniref:hypothetical protein n=1 Tax=Faecalispora jeddahensis TaxID=1414721 RepID=UPI0004B91FD8|nr:hypothetical protein [Faecalispora jeddahensis]
MNDILRDSIANIFSGISKNLVDITHQVTMSPAEAFGDSFWITILNLGATIVMPFAISILAYFMAAELYQVYCKANAELDLQLVSTTVLKFVFPFIFITKTYDLLKILFLQINGLILRIGEKVGLEAQNGSTDYNSWYNQIDGMSFLDKLAYLIQLQPLVFIMRGMGVIIMVIVYGRLFEIMLYWVFAPIPFATLIHSEYSQIGKNFIKLFAAVLLQGGFIILCVVFYTELIKTVAIQANMDGAWQMLGFSLLLVFMLTKTGTLSKKLLATY